MAAEIAWRSAPQAMSQASSTASTARSPMACVAIRQPVAAKGSIRRASVEESWKRMPALSSSSKLRGGAAQAAVQAFRAFFEWLTGRRLRHLHGGRAVAPHLLMKGADGGSLPRERRVRWLLQQMPRVVDKDADRDSSARDECRGADT